ncbi:uncharacterized protein ACA1_381270 [Acanthamoeba castellanii str. Neff]|uniref:Uncharacterized protein n=1 Tax=Acanthamoeba castellanii (strain ATCC 30010 / Neff) TaxID=1257118 RepID=L8GMX9_ACACF|nr:uncharacterized protein ACA1_381270 [Acanthamoeba castellanii str. Neff]ELR14430.1 hypothetical protein ACA1_381270 [Acanthamoeba castellanii str. Neff]
MSARTFISHDPPIAEPDDPELSMREAEKQKRINLEGTCPPPANTRKAVSDVPDAPGWNDRLASDSEANVKADRSELEDVHEMQEFTIKTIEQREEIEQEVEKEIEMSGLANDAVKAFAQESKEFPAGP